MEKSIHTEEYGILLELLRQARQNVGLTQVELAERLGTTQSFVTKVETGERRLDVIQLRTICQILQTSLLDLIARLEERLGTK